jgi:hypothetical protein
MEGGRSYCDCNMGWEEPEDVHRSSFWIRGPMDTARLPPCSEFEFILYIYYSAKLTPLKGSQLMTNTIQPSSNPSLPPVATGSTG